MADYNLVVIVGRLARKPVVKRGGKFKLPYTILDIRVNKQTMDEIGEPKSSVVKIQAACYQHQAEIAADLLDFGSSVMVSGRLVQKGKTLSVRVDRLHCLDSKKVQETV